MAQVTSGTVKSNTLWYSTFYVKWSRTSYSVENNSSTINWEAGLITTNNVYWLSNAVKINSIYINGSKVLSDKTYSNISGNGTHKLASGSTPIKHNEDGTKTFNISISGWLYDTGSPSGSETFELPTIPRASSVSGGSGNIGSTSTININRSSESFTHTLKYAFGNLTGTIATGVGTSYTWTIPTSFYAQIPNSNTGTGSITCETYNGSTLIGTSTVQLIANVVNSNPTVGSFAYKDNDARTVAITTNNQRIIRNNSELLFAIGTATAKNSASISKYEVTFNGVTKSRFSAGSISFGTVNLSSDANAILTVTDSRGNTATKQIKVIIDDWVLPTALIDLSRKNNFYSETYLKADATFSSLNGKNKIGIQYQAKKVNDKDFTVNGNLEDNVQATLDLDNNYQWYIEVIVTDSIGQTTYSLNLDRGMPIIFFDRKKTSVGINCFPSQENELEVNGYMVASTESFNSLSSLDNVGEEQDLQKSGLYTASVSNQWFHLINLRHRNGISDGVNYGLQIRNKFASGSKLEYRQQNNGTWNSWRTIQEEPVTLFENASGTTSNITLSESAGNFQFMEIFYVDNNGRSNKSVRVHSPQQKNVELSCIEPAPDNSPMRTYIRCSTWIINGTSITHDKSTFTTLSSSGISMTKDQYIKIYRVVGYR